MKKRIFVIALILIVLISIGALRVLHIMIDKNITSKKKMDEEFLEIWYEKKKINRTQNIADVIVMFYGDKGIEKIIKPDGMEVYPHDDKNLVAVDLRATPNTDYKYIVQSKDGKILEKNINVKIEPEIYKIEDLKEISIDLASNYFLMNDIDFKDINSYRSRYNYEFYTKDENSDGYPDNPFFIGGDFKGILDGKGYKINNYTIKKQEQAFLFDTGTNATIKNILIKNINIKYMNANNISDCGVLFGVGEKIKFDKVGLQGDFYCCVANGNTAPFVVEDNLCSYNNCYSNVNIIFNSGTTFAYDIGGFSVARWAYETGATFTNCYFGGTIQNVKSLGRMSNFFGGGPISNNENLQGIGILKNCFYDKEKFTYSVKPSGTGLTASQRINEENYTGWDFENTWYIDDDGNPELYFKDKEETNAKFEITLDGNNIEDALVKIITLSPQNAEETEKVLQYKVGNGDWQNYTQEFKLRKNCMLYGRLYNMDTGKTEYEFIKKIKVYNNIAFWLGCIDNNENIKLNDIITNQDLLIELLDNDKAYAYLQNSKDLILPTVEQEITNNTIKYVNSKMVMNKIMSSAELMTNAANSEDLMLAICESNIARNCLYENYQITQLILGNSENAKNAMKRSSNYKSITKNSYTRVSGTTQVADTVIDKKIFLLNVDVTVCNSTGLSLGGFTDGGANQRIATSPINVTVNRFMSKVMGAKVQADNNPTAIYYYLEI